ncbi:MAG: ATP synthase F0 subunit C [Candidatus Margulisbacteria bacterium]|nr:ATP synthase F0 subunit C [Candidatus Margulisiibacteriota bacterium]
MLAYLSAGIVLGIVGFAAAFGISHIGAKSVESMARQPEAIPDIRIAMIIAIAFVESIALYALVIAFMLLAK